MVVQNLRWGYDGGGVACGPVEGTSAAQLCVTHNGKNFYIIANGLSEARQVIVSELPLIDVIFDANHSEVAPEEYEKLHAHALEVYDSDLEETDDDEPMDYKFVWPKEMKKSTFAKAIRLAIDALDYYDAVLFGTEDPAKNATVAATFLKKLRGKEL